ncbi:hypothetical protein RGCCGE502_22825 [Rhizobium grahamii CCGE 502]|uniref:Uncharacterized protein n=1 Tax=Rhizobium grahamii CCGE 502 TaxID=990285 RepID=S3I8Q8_9HYPH|nr:hypothetical protein RGCCGE502_22825 [Rhizobium grahamii CCGE 502]
MKAATVAAVDAVGGVSRASQLLGMGTSALTKYCSTAEEWSKNFIRVDLAVALDRATAHPFISTAISQLVADQAPASVGELTASAVLRLDGVLDEVVRTIAVAIEDGHLDAAERQAVRSRIVPAMLFLARLDAMMAGAC